MRVYTPSKSVRFEERVRLCAMEAGVTPLHGPVALMVTFVFPMKGAPRKTKPRRAAWKPTRPDLSNLVKSVEDGLNSVGYADDAQVVSIHAHKTHAAQGESPHTEVILQRVGEYAPEGGERW